MSAPRLFSLSFRPSLAWALFCFLLVTLWGAGGASRADAAGQVVIRVVATLVLVAGILFGARPALGKRAMPIVLFLLAAVLLGLLQLVPLPPAMWEAIPGRAILENAATLSGQAQPWRPWAIVPGAALNAIESLIVPAATLYLILSMGDEERRRLPGLLLCFIAASTLVGLLQFSGAGFNNPLINDTPGQVSGTFANRNHLALLLAQGCLLAPVWAFLEGRQPHWRGPVAIGFVLLFALTILASGSRTGLVLGILALGIALVTVRQGIRRVLSRYPRWAFPALVATIVGVISMFVLISFAADRAVSINRALAIDPGQDMRSRGLPTVMAMIREYFPFGSGLGGFDPIFRAHEPFALLKLSYFNHAHNDWLEIVLDAGLLGLLLLVTVVLWWVWASIRAWRAGASTRYALPKLGSAMLLLVMIASAFDYPARTPVIMAVIVMAGVWLSEAGEGRSGSALPKADQHL